MPKLRSHQYYPSFPVTLKMQIFVLIAGDTIHQCNLGLLYNLELALLEWLVISRGHKECRGVEGKEEGRTAIKRDLSSGQENNLRKYLRQDPH